MSRFKVEEVMMRNTTFSKLNRRVTIEYIMIQDLNDMESVARRI